MRVERFKELDGMRGLASIMVISYHIFKRGEYFTTNPILHFVTGVTLYNWYAIETFFVLSGFLITSILLRTKGEPHFFRNFYVRRSLRVFPLYYFALIVIIALLPTVEPDYMPELPRLIPILLLYQQNWVYIIGNVKTTIYLASPGRWLWRSNSIWPGRSW
jgi:peptidoglycan/LPS O-acetylase OafA/YrhL